MVSKIQVSMMVMVLSLPLSVVGSCADQSQVKNTEDLRRINSAKNERAVQSYKKSILRDHEKCLQNAKADPLKIQECQETISNFVVMIHQAR